MSASPVQPGKGPPRQRSVAASAVVIGLILGAICGDLIPIQRELALTGDMESARLSVKGFTLWEFTGTPSEWVPALVQIRILLVLGFGLVGAALGALASWDNRYLGPILITCILIGASWTYGALEVYYSPLLARLTSGLITHYSPTFVAILTAVALELIMGRLWGGRWPHLASAYISGISVGILIRTNELWPYVVCSLISIASKYALRVRGRHLWNPSNFGVSVLLFLAPGYVAALSFQWGSEIWPVIIIWCLGSMILFRLGLLHITLTYAVAFVLLAVLRSEITGKQLETTLAPITGPMYQLFMFFMITDPKTITRKKWSQCLVVVLVAVVETILRLNEVIYAPFYALFIVGPVTNLIEILWTTRPKGAQPSPASAALAAAVAPQEAPPKEVAISSARPANERL